MSLTHYMIKLGIGESDLQEIIRKADQGSSLQDIHADSRHGLSVRQIYAMLARYCREDGGASIELQYPALHDEFFSVRQNEEEVIKHRTITKNNKALEETYEDLILMEEERDIKP